MEKVFFKIPKGATEEEEDEIIRDTVFRIMKQSNPELSQEEFSQFYEGEDDLTDSESAGVITSAADQDMTCIKYDD